MFNFSIDENGKIIIIDKTGRINSPSRGMVSNKILNNTVKRLADIVGASRYIFGRGLNIDNIIKDYKIKYKDFIYNFEDMEEVIYGIRSIEDLKENFDDQMAEAESVEDKDNLMLKREMPNLEEVKKIISNLQNKMYVISKLDIAPYKYFRDEIRKEFVFSLNLFLSKNENDISEAFKHLKKSMEYIRDLRKIEMYFEKK